MPPTDEKQRIILAASLAVVLTIILAKTLIAAGEWRGVGDMRQKKKKTPKGISIARSAFLFDRTNDIYVCAYLRNTSFMS